MSGLTPDVGSIPYQYIVLHQSLRHSPGIAAVQAAHAAAESILKLPVDPSTYVCVLMAEKSDDLVALGERLIEAGIGRIVIFEPDPPYNGAAVAVGVEPCPRSRVRELVRQFKVFR